MKKKTIEKIMLIFSLAVLIIGLIFVLFIVIKGVNTSFEATQDAAKETAGALIRLPRIMKVR